MVNKGLIDQIRDQIARTIATDSDEIILAALAAGVPMSDIKLGDIKLGEFHPYTFPGDTSFVGLVIWIGGYGAPVTVELH
ncbi:hypothetical protein GL177_19385 [Vibrio toranzoniae]|uniref:hypothetical protein n=1 Tax=Vibrio toranzoniae TaxID=1194427 RepID=UPI001376D5B0|nr:hypothetical protein [Vibrio toranzoniae]NAZ55478.1 hypothetical protein [Vibrio toranzoniae]